MSLSERSYVVRVGRLAGLLIFASSTIAVAIWGGLPSLDSVLALIVSGVVLGILIGGLLRLAIPRAKRRDFIYALHPGLAERVLRRPSRGTK